MTVNVAVADPPEVEIVIVRSPGTAVELSRKTAEAVVALATPMLLTTMSVPASTLSPLLKFVPVSVTLTVAPTSPDDGDTAVTVGVGGVTENVTGLLAPMVVDITTLRGPMLAVESIVNVAV